jgi:hypothetical protein
MKRAFPLVAALALAACATLPAATGPSATIGEIAGVGTFRVRPIEVVEDSRCPINARCVWAGRLILRAEVSKRGFRQVRNLVLGEAQDVPGGKLTLESAEPGKLAGEQPPPPPTRFTFKYD